MVNLSKLMKSLGKYFGGLLLVMGILAFVQLSYASQMTDPENGTLINFLKEEGEIFALKQCAEEGIPEDLCLTGFQEGFKEAEEKLTSEESPIFKINEYSSRFKGIGIVLAVVGAVLLVASVGLNLNLLKAFGSSSTSIGGFSLANFFVLKMFIIPQMSGLGKGDMFPIGELLQKFLIQEILPYQLYIAKIFLIIGISLLISFYAVSWKFKQE